MATQGQWRSNWERFQAGLAPRLNPRFVPDATRWDISHVKDWNELFLIVEGAIQNFPTLHLVLDGGTPAALEQVKTVLKNNIPNFKIRYWWIPPMGRDVRYQPKATEWPSCYEFHVVSPLSPAFHGGMHDIVVLLPPDDFPERRKRWQDYLMGSWIVIAWQQTMLDQEKLIAEFKSSIEERARRFKHTPRLFTGGLSGKLRHESCYQHGVRPLPDKFGIRP